LATVTAGYPYRIRVEATLIVTVWLGALLVICGILYMALAAIFRGRSSDPDLSSVRTETLEPTRPGLRFLGIKSNWPGLLGLVAVGPSELIAS